MNLYTYTKDQSQFTVMSHCHTHSLSYMHHISWSYKTVHGCRQGASWPASWRCCHCVRACLLSRGVPWSGRGGLAQQPLEVQVLQQRVGLLVQRVIIGGGNPIISIVRRRRRRRRAPLGRRVRAQPEAKSKLKTSIDESLGCKHTQTHTHYISTHTTHTYIV